MSKSHNKPTFSSFPIRTDLQTEPNFDSDAFEKVIDNLGYDCLVEKHLKCPCRSVITGAALSNCKNCKGTGHIFIERRKTRMAIQFMNRDTKFKSWSEHDKGTISISGRFRDELCFMDRVIVLDTRTYFSQLIKLRQDKTTSSLFGFLFYYPLSISEIYLFKDADEPLIPLLLDVDYTINNNLLILNKTKYQYLYDNIDSSKNSINVSIRYQHYPTFNIIDIVRADVKNREEDCSETEYLANMPINAIARKTHFLLDDPDFDGESVFDNTVYTTGSTQINQDIFNSSDPTNVDAVKISFEESITWSFTISDYFDTDKIFIREIYSLTENVILKGSDILYTDIDILNDFVVVQLMKPHKGFLIVTTFENDKQTKQ